ncbi:MAG: undecaprenyl-diphosphate phosphatase [Actinobacteria bacterium]|nr:undecaprenyl-diphosphate phosphatase [Actinomycetota bacterium]MCL5069879.1 undecaprenyl-diphosphate phosphatase [Actinomycetota bacterium]
MSIIQSIIYGIVQGITEFLPISSTAHLILIPWFFGWKDPGIVFDIALHIGTALAVILFFIKDWIILIRAGFTKPKSDDGKLFWFIAVATVPGGLAGMLLDDYMERIRNPLLIGIVLIIFGIVLYLADRIGKNKIELKNMGLLRSLYIGLSQALAVIPGISRSGVTMSAGRFLGMTRESIAKFTFLLSGPIILAAGLYHIKDLNSMSVDTIPFVTAILTSAIVGALAIKFLLIYLKKWGFGLFALYRFALGAFIIILYFVRLNF